MHWWLWESWVPANPGERLAMLRADAPFLDSHGRENSERGVRMCSAVIELAVNLTGSTITCELGPWGCLGC